MQASIPLEQPVLLQEGKYYYLRLSPMEERMPVLTQVIFYGYTACPAIVIVQDGRKEKLRCSRDDLFSYNQGG